MIYLIGSLKTPRAREVAKALREHGFDVFDDWAAAGEKADWYWEDYEREYRNRNFREALKGKAAINSFEFDLRHLLACDAAVLVAPAGKSAHLELGLILGRSRPGFILLDGEPKEFDLMYKLATDICYDIEELVVAMGKAGL